MEKDAAGCPSLPLQYGLTNPGTNRTSPAAYPTHAGFDERGVETEHGEASEAPATERAGHR
jgi:hypothetical protein